MVLVGQQAPVIRRVLAHPAHHLSQVGEPKMIFYLNSNNLGLETLVYTYFGKLATISNLRYKHRETPRDALLKFNVTTEKMVSPFTFIVYQK